MCATLSVLIPAWLAVAVVMAALWLHQVKTLNANLVDVGWAAGVGSLGIVYAVLGDGDLVRRGLLAVMTGTWGLRLAWHICARARRHPQEDGRYRYLRSHWSSRTELKFFWFYQAQALTVMLFSLPFWVIAHTAQPASFALLAVAVLIWLVALSGESIADRQLAEWREDPSNQGFTCRAGLWRYSRHPNYFFEWLHWWSYVVLAWGHPAWWVSLLAQATMLVTLFWVTGIPHTERQALASRGDDYRAYQASTSVFFPWFPKRDARTRR